MTDTSNLAPGPDRTAALEQYRQRAGVYDLELALFEPLRRQAISRLGLRHGDCVLDVVESRRRGGLKGGRSRAEALTPDQRAAIASIAANARWKRRK